MTELSLKKSEIAVLTEAAGQQDGLIVVPGTMNEETARRLADKLLKHGLIAARQVEDGTAHHLTPAGYRAVGQEPPPAPTDKPTGDKRHRVLSLLRRSEGATIEELTDATGWLPHTTRAALSRLRSTGEPILKGKRPDGPTVYRSISEPASRRHNPPPVSKASEFEAAE